MARNITLTVHDAFNNVATGYRGTVHFTSSDPQAVLPANYTFTAADAGTHQFGVTLKTAGSQTVTLSDPATATLAATSTPVAVFPANLNLVRLWWDKPWPMRLGAIARLPLQIPMITAANKVRRVS